MAYTLDDYITYSLKYANIQNLDTNTLTDDQLTHLINVERRDIWNIIIDQDENFGIGHSTITTVDGTVLYDLPSDYRKLINLTNSTGIPLTVDKRCVEYVDKKTWSNPLSIYCKEGNKLRILSSAGGTVYLTYIKDIYEYSYVDEVTDDDGDITTYGITSEEPDLPKYAADKVPNRVARRIHMIEGDTNWYGIFDEMCEKDEKTIRSNSIEHMHPTLIGGNDGDY